MKIKLVSAVPVITRHKAEPGDMEEASMPDFRGMTIRDALRKAREKGIELNVSGNGWAVSQVPAPGVAIAELRYCTVSFSTGN